MKQAIRQSGIMQKDRCDKAPYLAGPDQRIDLHAQQGDDVLLEQIQPRQLKQIDEDGEAKDRIRDRWFCVGHRHLDHARLRRLRILWIGRGLVHFSPIRTYKLTTRGVTFWCSARMIAMTVSMVVSRQPSLFTMT